MKKFSCFCLVICLIFSFTACGNKVTTAEAVEKSVMITNESSNLNNTYLDNWFTYMNCCEVKKPNGFTVSGKLDSWAVYTGSDCSIYTNLIEVVIDGVPYITSINNVVMWYEVEGK